MKYHSLYRYICFNVMGMIGFSCYILADTYFVSAKMGADGLTALNLAISVYSVLQAAGLMIGIGGAARYSILGEKENAKTIFSHSVLLGSIASVIFMLLGLFFTKPLASMLGAEKEILPMVVEYLRVILLCSPFFLFNNILLAFVRNDRAPKLSMIGMLVGSFANIILDYWFIFPLNMGMFGAAFATCLAPVFSMGILSFHFIKGQSGFSFYRCAIQIKELWNILRMGISSFVLEISSGITLMVFNLLMLKFAGNLGVAAYGIVANLALVVLAVFTGIGQGMQPLVSRYYGQGKSR